MALRTTPPTISREEWQEAANEAVRRQNEFYRTARISEQTESDETISTLNSAPAEEFQPLVQENEEEEQRQEEQSANEENEEAEETMSNTTPPEATDVTGKALTNDKQRKQNSNKISALKSEIQTLKQELELLQTKLETLKKERFAAMRKDITKLIATSEFILTIPYYLAKIILKTIFNKQSAEIRKIKQTITKIEEKILKLEKQVLLLEKKRT